MRHNGSDPLGFVAVMAAIGFCLPLCLIIMFLVKVWIEWRLGL